MANTSSRALRLLSLLQTHRFWPGGELADRLEVSERTLRRDIDRLRELGYPVNATRGADGGYQLGAGAAMPPLTVEEDEAIAMAVALGNAAHQGSGALAEASLSALSKVVQVLPAKLKRRAEALRSVTVDSPFGTAPEVSAEVLSIVAQTIRDEERLRFRYTARGGGGGGRRGPRSPRGTPPAGDGRPPLVPRGIRPRTAGLALVPARPALRTHGHARPVQAPRHPRR
ncbi:hypothetical protein BN10_270011 [Phycicoccus elongatus Lp2]|uniref:HTH deoR-type domain-containing protein n=1 Tax=Phycicoccus elongatus Lp2 TaxID=1193181 RepID=N0E1F7_9MICO|nr:hypothetical protein BN10_270011 [Phycicoccus elongatus Lp2]